MRCPMCNEQARRVRDVKHETDPDGWSMVTRHRVCGCGHTFTTYECYEYADVEVIFKARQCIEILTSIDKAGRP